MTIPREAIGAFAVTVSLRAITKVPLVHRLVVSTHVGYAARPSVGPAARVPAIFVWATLSLPMFSVYELAMLLQKIVKGQTVEACCRGDRNRASKQRQLIYVANHQAMPVDCLNYMNAQTSSLPFTFL